MVLTAQIISSPMACTERRGILGRYIRNTIERKQFGQCRAKNTTALWHALHRPSSAQPCLPAQCTCMHEKLSWLRQG